MVFVILGGGDAGSESIRMEYGSRQIKEQGTPQLFSLWNYSKKISIEMLVNSQIQGMDGGSIIS